MQEVEGEERDRLRNRRRDLWNEGSRRAQNGLIEELDVLIAVALERLGLSIRVF